MTWLRQLLPFLTVEVEATLLVNVFPLATFALLLILVVGWLVAPPSAKVRIKAKLKRSGVLVALFSDEGFERTELMRSDLGQGILSGNDVSYIFTPRPEEVKDDQGNKRVDISKDQKRNIDEAMLHRMFSDTGKPLYLGYIGKSVAVTAKLLDLMKRSGGRLRLNLGKTPRANPEVNMLELLDPRILQRYITKTFSRSLIESIKFENERKGFLRRPVQEFVKKAALPVGIILVIAVLAFVLLSGGIDLSGIIGGG